MSDIAWTGDAMAYALAHVKAGVLVVDGAGRVWRRKLWLHGRRQWSAHARRRAENVGGKGYLRVSLAKPGGGLAIVMAHNLVYRVLVGEIPHGLELDHKNTKKDDNRPSNLEPVTGSVNMKRAYANGRAKAWTKTAPPPYDAGRTRPWTNATEWRAGRPRLTERTDR